LLPKEYRVAGGNAVELAAQIVDHEQIAIWAIGVSEPEIDAYRILFDGVHLREHIRRQESVE
jgi:hypothetical protein